MQQGCGDHANDLHNPHKSRQYSTCCKVVGGSAQAKQAFLALCTSSQCSEFVPETPFLACGEGTLHAEL